MLISYQNGQTSVILRVKLRQDTTGANPGDGITGLTNSSTGLVIGTIADNEASTTTYTSAASHIQTIATLGTYAAPSASNCRFKEVDSTNHPGVYEIQLADARYGVSNAKSLLVSISGVSGLADCDVVIPLLAVNPYDGTAGGISRIDAAVSSRSTYAGGAVASVTGNVVGTIGGYASGQDPATLVGQNLLIDGKTFQAAIQYIAASCAGKVSGAGTGTELFKGLDGSTTRLTVTADSSGNRSAVIYG